MRDKHKGMMLQKILKSVFYKKPLSTHKKQTLVSAIFFQDFTVQSKIGVIDLSEIYYLCKISQARYLTYYEYKYEVLKNGSF